MVKSMDHMKLLLNTFGFNVGSNVDGDFDGIFVGINVKYLLFLLVKSMDLYLVKCTIINSIFVGNNDGFIEGFNVLLVNLF